MRVTLNLSLLQASQRDKNTRKKRKIKTTREREGRGGEREREVLERKECAAAVAVHFLVVSIVCTTAHRSSIV